MNKDTWAIIGVIVALHAVTLGFLWSLKGDVSDLKGDVSSLKVRVDVLETSTAGIREGLGSLANLARLTLESLGGGAFFVGHERDDETKAFTYTRNPATGALLHFDSATGNAFSPNDPVYLDPASGQYIDTPLLR